MHKQDVTIYDVAREAKVSMATVSRVVNGNNNVRKETRDRVMEVIKRLHYQPNAVAQGLASKRTTTVGLIVLCRIVKGDRRHCCFVQVQYHHLQRGKPLDEGRRRHSRLAQQAG